ncbi:MAG: RIP metalloprotease RseP, partial [Nitrospirae bacterium]
PTRFVIQRGQRKFEVTIVPREEKEKLNGKEITIGRIGIKKDVKNLIYQIKADSLIEVPLKATVATYRMVEFVLDSIKMFITGTVSVKNLGGPITIVKESGKAAQAGVLAYFMFMALLSVNLGVLNLLPIPVLDGGHLLLYTVEGLKGEPLTERTVIIVNRIGYAILVLLMGLALYNDIFRLFSK